MRNKAELLAVQRMLARRRADVLPLNGPITQRAIALMEALALSHGLQMGDALIASTALEHALPRSGAGRLQGAPLATCRCAARHSGMPPRNQYTRW